MFFNWFKNKDPITGNKYSVNILTSEEKHALVEGWHAPPSLPPLTHDEKILISQIKRQTLLLNKNNITRTQAYLEVYLNHPDLHWAFLAHMVSRNAGWNMTDLKRHNSSGLMGYDRISVFFSFLEKGNQLIFQDAFPQLILFAAGKRQNKDFSYLLGHFGISPFMIPVWKLFMKQQEKNFRMLTVSLIINEQSLLEKHVLKNPFYEQKVVNSLTFQLQERMGFTQILFPYLYRNEMQVTGSTIDDFTSLKSRIEFGKELYMTLFFGKNVHQGAVAFGRESAHTGSRSDYMPEVFSTEADSMKMYSPLLEKAWQDYQHKTPTKLEDWFRPESSDNLLRFYKLKDTSEAPDMKKKHLMTMLGLSSLGEMHKLIT